MKDRIKEILQKSGDVKYLTIYLLLIVSLCGIGSGTDVVKYIIFISMIAFAAVVFLQEKQKHGIILRKPDKILEWGVLILGGGSFLCILLYCIGIDVGYWDGYDIELVMLAVTLLYWTMNHDRNKMMDRMYLKVAVHIGTLIMMLCLMRYVLFDELDVVMGNLLSDTWAVAMVSMLTGLLATMLYCFEKDRGQKRIYVTEAILSFFVLAINHNVISLYIMAGVLLIMLTCNKENIEVLKRNLQMFFAYGFLISNMSLITNYANILIVKCEGYSLETSVFLELVLAVFVLVILHFWDKIKAEKAWIAGILVQDLQKTIRRLLAAILLFIFVIFLSGQAFAELPGGFMMDVITNETNIFLAAVQECRYSNFYYQAMDAYGLFGGAVAVLLTVLCFFRVRQNRKMLQPENIMLTMIAVLFGMTLFSYSGNLAVQGIYMIFLIFALIPDMQYEQRI